MAYIRVKRGKFKVEINKKGYPRVFKSFHKIKDTKKFANNGVENLNPLNVKYF